MTRTFAMLSASSKTMAKPREPMARTNVRTNERLQPLTNLVTYLSACEKTQPGGRHE